MQEIQNLIATGNIKKAIELLGNSNEVIQLKARLASLERGERLGFISFSDASIQRAQITNAVLEMAKEIFKPMSSHEITLPRMSHQNFTHESALQTIIAENKRRRPEIAQKAGAILQKYREYTDTKAASPAFDPVSRRYNAIMTEAKDLVERLEEEKLKGTENIVEAVMGWLEEPIPTFHELSEAYKLCSGRGYNNSWIEAQLQNRPADTEVNIQIAEKLEDYIATVKVRK